jgi:phage-related tail protein
MSTDTQGNVYEQALDNMRKAAESSLKMQQDAMQQWTTLWPGFSSPQAVWLDKIKDFQRQWTNAVSDMAHKHRTTLDRQYQAALESLEEALRTGESSNPEEYRRRVEQFCRKSLECMREASEAQMKEYHDAINKMTELIGKTGS